MFARTKGPRKCSHRWLRVVFIAPELQEDKMQLETTLWCSIYRKSSENNSYCKQRSRLHSALDRQSLFFQNWTEKVKSNLHLRTFKVKILQRPCDNISPVRIGISVIWGCFLFFSRFFCVFHTFFLPFSRLRIMEAALGIINESFDSILGANSGGSSEEQKMIRWITCMAACGKEHFSIFQQAHQLLY